MDNKNYLAKRIIFFGSAEFSRPSLKLLHTAGFKIVAVVTMPDKPYGRGKKMTENVIKKWTTTNRLPVLQPEIINDANFINQIITLKPDLFIVVAYGKILPKAILDIPKLGAINVHGSLLPKYRGASPVQAAILAKEKITGVSIMLMDKGMDTGPVLQKIETSIEQNATAEELSDKLARLGAGVLVETIQNWINAKITPTPQNNNEATICKKISKQDGIIDWQKTGNEIDRMVRAFFPWPSAWTRTADATVLKILRVTPSEYLSDTRGPGEIFIIDKKVAVACGNKTTVILECIQPQGKKIMSALDYINGHKQLVGSKFTN